MGEIVALVKCGSCDWPVDIGAKTCPRCGAPEPAFWHQLGGVLSLLLVGLVLTPFFSTMCFGAPELVRSPKPSATGKARSENTKPGHAPSVGTSENAGSDRTPSVGVFEHARPGNTPYSGASTGSGHSNRPAVTVASEKTAPKSVQCVLQNSSQPLTITCENVGRHFPGRVVSWIDSASIKHNCATAQQQSLGCPAGSRCAVEDPHDKLRFSIGTCR